MQNFPAIYTSKGGKQVTNARSLYDFLELADGQFTRWAKLHIVENPFATQGIDYQQFDTRVELHNGGSRQVDEYVLTISFAKKLAMASNSPKGDEVRDYFLTCEEQLKQISTPSYQIENPIERARRWIEEQQQVQTLANENEALKPKAEYADAVLLSQSELLTTIIAKELGKSAVTLNRILQEKGVQHKVGNTWVLNHRYQDKGYTRMRTHVHSSTSGKMRTEHHLVWTEKGRAFIHALINPNLGNAPYQAQLPGIA